MREPAHEFDFPEDDPDDEPQRQRTLAALQRQAVRAVAMDHDDGLGLDM
jgi:type IV secretion system protein VirD4